MSEFNEDYLNGYTKAKEEDKEEIEKLNNDLHRYETEYTILKEENKKNANFIKENIKYMEAGKALHTIMKYFWSEENVE